MPITSCTTLTSRPLHAHRSPAAVDCCVMPPVRAGLWAGAMLRPVGRAGLAHTLRSSCVRACQCSAQRCVSFVAASEAAMQAVAAGLAARLQPGDVYLLQGAVGAGKTAFRHASALVRLVCCLVAGSLLHG